MRRILLLFQATFIFIIFQTSLIADVNAFNLNKPILIKNDSIWVDSVFNSLSTDERIAQLLIVRANNPGEDYFDHINKYIKDYNIAGVTFFKSSPLKQALQTNLWQSIAKTPLFISIDAEWGLGMRLDSIISFPFQITLGAIKNDSLVYEMGSEIAKQCKQLGIQMNFAPVVDINCNPKNPVINSRSFGEDRTNVSDKGLAYMNGLQDNGIIAVAKHFPGHGDTETDSHKTLPIVNHSKERLDSLELYPFKKLINNGLDGIMIAHLYLPSYESQENTATTLSKPVVTGILKDKMNFKGLIVTDALDMKGVTKYFKPGNIEVKALEAGNDILLLPSDVPKAIKKIKKAVKKGIISQSDIDEKCKKILKFKYKSGLNNYKPVEIENIYHELNNRKAEFINRKLYESAITIVKNNNELIPLINLDTLKIASVTIGEKKVNHFQKMMGNYAKIDNYSLTDGATEQEINLLSAQLLKYNLIIISIHGTNIFASKDFGIGTQTIDLINSIRKHQKIILNIFANPYSLSRFYDTDNIETLIISYQDNQVSQEISAQIIFGGIAAKGKLPVTASFDFPINTGFETDKIRLKYTVPEEFNIQANDIYIIDSTAISGIENKAYPGCQIIAGKDGKIFYNKTFGSFTYQNKIPVKKEDLYDLASITKIAATTIAIMKLSDEGKIDIDQQVSKYLPYLKGTDKEKIIIRELLAHQAKFQSWIPYFKSTLIDVKLDTLIYNDKISENFPVRVAENIYIRKNYFYNIIDSIIQSPPMENNKYKYSDLGFYLLKEIIENITNQPIEDYVTEIFYKPLGLTTLTYLPRNKFELSRIVPTEDDKIFRKQLLHGDVHDPGAAMLGGVSGHAGLFSNANDMAIFMQMLLQNGEYAGINYVDTLTVKEFTKQQFPLNDNRRGIGFDKPLPVYDEDGPTCKSASLESFGHSGFTGTYAWADPENNLIYIFLSNRVHPDVSNNKITELDIRTNIHQAIYDALENAKK
ncbi:MAG: serine hydrolase [Bacteroidales bacterium]|nr:serine hydrolase [Bacteroidales bacterium]